MFLRRGTLPRSGGRLGAGEAERSGDLVIWSLLLLPPPSTSFRGASTLPLSLAMSALDWDSVSHLLLNSLLRDNLLTGEREDSGLAAEEQTSQLYHPHIIFSTGTQRLFGTEQ